MIYKCPRCLFMFDRLSDIKRHINRTNICTKINDIIPNVENIIREEEENKICEFCKNRFASDRTLNKHHLNCKEKTKFLEKQVQELKVKLAESKTINNTNNTINNTNNNFIIVQLRPYNDPKLPDDMDDIYEDAWSKKKSLVTFIERLHMSPDLPENHNMCITNLKSKLAKVFTEQGWVTKDEDALLDEIITHTTHLMDRWVRADPQRRIQYEEEYFDYLERIGHKRINDENKDDIRLLLYDSQKIGIVNIKSNTVKFTPPIDDVF